MVRQEVYVLWANGHVPGTQRDGAQEATHCV